MGGGRSNLLPSKISSSSFLEKGNRLDNVNLIEEWIKNKANREPSDYKYVTTRDELLSMAKTPSFLLGKTIFGVSK